jgi:polysaccharide pyruvyl transferase WcaK-like protein
MLLTFPRAGCIVYYNLYISTVFIKFGADMKQYTYISARESMTYEMLRKAGLTNIGLAPDAAFTLETERLPLPDGFVEGNTIGINLSPLVVRKETADGVVMENFVRLVQYILENTDCSVALIPHVVWQGSDDRTVLKELYQKIGRPDRVVLIGDHNCMQLKGFIARCRFFVGARTHATIAAYSSGVPTLGLGYSVKSRGIAKDLFGTDEHYVIPVQTLDHPEAMTTAFCRLWAQEQEIRTRLHEIMTDYIAQAWSVRDAVKEALERD